jgi:hypothetical protein
MDPWEQVSAVLAEAKREGLPWDEAWFKAMRSLSPERTATVSQQLRDALAEERDLMREVKPWWRAAYEGREVTVDEFERASEKTEKRIDSLLAAA